MPSSQKLNHADGLSQFNARSTMGDSDADCRILSPDGSRDGRRVASRPVRSGRLFSQLAPLDNASDLTEVFALLRERTGLDFTLYKPDTLRRRLAQRISISHSETLANYIDKIHGDPHELAVLFESMLITVSNFFRDPEVFRTLRLRVLPKLIQRRLQEGGDLRIWSIGCARGEEVYSLAIVAAEAIEKARAPMRVHVFGTDVSETALAVARVGTYPAAIVRDVSAARLRRFFTKVPGGYRISRDIRGLCTIARQDITSDPPFAHIDLLSSRNVLMYFGPELQRRVIRIFHYALNPRGYLVLGREEGIATSAEEFECVDRRRRIFVQRPGPLPHGLLWRPSPTVSSGPPRCLWV